jgi:hypothetical protein
MASGTKQPATDKRSNLSLTDRIQLEVIPLVVKHARRLPMSVMPRPLAGVFGAVT